MATIRKFEVSTVVEVTDPAYDDEREAEGWEHVSPIIEAMAVSQARFVIQRWEAGDRGYLSVHVNEVP